MKKILVLGHNGMLGNAVVKFLSNNYHIDTIESRFPSIEFEEFIKNYNGDFIVNAIGSIPQKTNEFKNNTNLPIFLDVNSKCKIVHPGTDCDYDGTEYGKSKELATEWLITNSKNTKMIQTSIIGIEVNTSYSLLSWTLNQTGTINGYTDAKWNGITTLEWVKQCEILINNWETFETVNVYCSECISKFELLNNINKIFDLKLEIIPEKKGENKCLNGNKVSNIKQQLKELKNFYKL